MTETRYFINGEYAQLLKTQSQDTISSVRVALKHCFGLSEIKNPVYIDHESHRNNAKKQYVEFVDHQYVTGKVVDASTLNQNFWQLPGYGDKTHADCGKVWNGEYFICFEVGKHNLLGVSNVKRGKEFAEVNTIGKASVKLLACTCNHLSCPVCYPSTISRMTQRAVAHLMRMPADNGFIPTNLTKRSLKNKIVTQHDDVIPPKRMLKPEDTTIYGKYKHVVVSPSEKDKQLIKTDSGYRELTKKMIKLLRKVGYVGSLYIPHPFKVKRKQGVDLSMVTENTDSVTMYQYAHYNNRECTVSWDLHFHNIALGELNKQAVKEMYEETGWIIKELDERETVYGTIFYQLTHAGYHKRFDTVNYWGVLSRKSRVLFEEEEKEVSLGPECACGSIMKPYIWVGEGDPVLKDEAERNEMGIYWLKLDPNNFREVVRLRAEQTIDKDYDPDDFEYKFVDEGDQ